MGLIDVMRPQLQFPMGFSYASPTSMAAATRTASSTQVPLCVDLDGTLIRSDMLWESLVRLLRKNPLWLAVVPIWWMRGRACLKQQIARRVELDVATLPYHEPFL